jgi:hypothetical protein
MADVVFIGKLIMQYPLDQRQLNSNPNAFFVRDNVHIFHPHKAFKNKDELKNYDDNNFKDTLILQSGSSCSFNMHEGQEYLIFASQMEIGTAYFTNMCQGSGSLKFREKLIRDLNRNEKLVEKLIVGVGTLFTTMKLKTYSI